MNSTTRLIAKVSALGAVGMGAAWVETLGGGFQRGISEGYARLVGHSVEWFGLPAYVDGTAVYSLGYAVRVVPECNGMIGTLVALAAVSLLKLSRLQRIKLYALTLVVSLMFNTMRIAGVLVLGTRSSALADTFHEVLFPAIWFCLGVGLWFQWLRHEYATQEGAPVGGRS